jgi:hypothetical protein
MILLDLDIVPLIVREIDRHRLSLHNDWCLFLWLFFRELLDYLLLRLGLFLLFAFVFSGFGLNDLLLWLWLWLLLF